MEYFPGQAFFEHKRDNELVVGGYLTDNDDSEELFSRLISSVITSMNDVCITVPEIAYSDDFMIVEFDKNCNIINVKSFNQIHTEYLFIHGHSFVAYNSNKRAIRDSPWI